jgi:hypothetical protein|tara:strand:- start:360 stop:602 length:243 start_codon:yes stop_codon:yes gene_type:complete
MENFKIVNRNTGATYFLNEKEYDTFFLRNKMYKDGEFKYDIYNLTEAKTRRTNKMLDVVAHLCIIGASILGTLLYIQNYC